MLSRRSASLALVLLAVTVQAQLAAVTADKLSGLKWRSIGPSVMVGRITDIEGVPSDPKTFYVATATGGLWKTTNAGTTFEPLFQDQGSISLGDVAVSPSDPQIVWVGTGEHHARNSVSWGDGVYKSTDGGKTWQNMGLRASFQIGRIAIHPTDPNTVYVGALGRLWGPSEERGLFKTTDGGKTWQKAHYLNDRTGVIDVQIDPKDPDTVLFATYERARDLHDSVPNYDPSTKWSGHSAIYKTTDGGRTFSRLSSGLPTVRMGRIGLDYYRKDPDVVFAVIETELVGANAEQIEAALKRTDRTEQTYTGRREFAGAYQGQQQNVQDRQGPNGFQTGGVFKSTDGGESWVRINSATQRPFYYSQVRADPNDDGILFLLGLQLLRSTDGGKTFENSGRNTHSDHHAFWFDPNDSEHLLLGNDGGVYQSWDRGDTWNYHANIVASQIYHIAIDTNEPYNVFAGFQDNGSWGGPSRKRNGSGNRNEDWVRVGGGDGFVCLVDPEDPDTVYVEIQDGGMTRLDMRTGVRTPIRPPQKEGVDYRFLWDTPMALSHHDSKTFYCMGQFVYRSFERGENLLQISPDLARTARGSGSAFAESPLDNMVLWAGTDDGYLWVTRDSGVTWTNVTANVGLPRHCYVSRIEPSRYVTGRAYVAFDGHRSDYDGPLVFVTDDFGATWRNLSVGLPNGSTRVVREDPTNEDLLYLGTEFTAYASLDRGQTWIDLKPLGLPTGAVHDLLVQKEYGELVAGTHGRGIWILDVAPLQQMTADSIDGEPVLFQPVTATQWNPGPPPKGVNYGTQNLSTDPTGNSATITYWLTERANEVKLVVRTSADEEVAVLTPSNVPGVNRVEWGLRRTGQGPALGPGEYKVVLTVDGKAITRTLTVRADPG
jgi:photosystem II stability/assembly factor-like uncharacterized protein